MQSDQSLAAAVSFLPGDSDSCFSSLIIPVICLSWWPSFRRYSMSGEWIIIGYCGPNILGDILGVSALLSCLDHLILTYQNSQWRLPGKDHNNHLYVAILPLQQHSTSGYFSIVNQMHRVLRKDRGHKRGYSRKDLSLSLSPFIDRGQGRIDLLDSQEASTRTYTKTKQGQESSFLVPAQPIISPWMGEGRYCSSAMET